MLLIRSRRSFSSVSLVDLARPHAEVIRTLDTACKSNGFFYVKNHCVSPLLLQEVFQASKQFFDLSLETKLKYLADKNNRGYTPLHEELLDPHKQKIGDTKQGYYIGKEIALDDRRASLPLHGPNVWPDPRLLPGWRELMNEYFSAMHCLGLRLTMLLSEVLDARGAFSAPGAFDDPMLFLRLLHYAPTVSKPEEGVFGAGAHTDYGMLTLLATDQNPGLQIWQPENSPAPNRESGGMWVDVPPRPDTFVVNLGDMLQIWSNDVLKSTRHRVINTNGQDRYSIPFFFEPNFTCQVKPLASCCSPANPARYGETTSGKHLLDRYRTSHANFQAQNAN